MRDYDDVTTLCDINKCEECQRFMDDCDGDWDRIVVCADCRYCKERGGHANCNGWLTCTKFGRSVDEDDFCSWGERRE